MKRFIRTKDNRIIDTTKTTGIYNKYSRAKIENNKFIYKYKSFNVGIKDLRTIELEIVSDSNNPLALCDIVLWIKNGKLINCKPVKDLNIEEYDFLQDIVDYNYEIYGGLLDYDVINFECKYIPEHKCFKLLDEDVE